MVLFSKLRSLPFSAFLQSEQSDGHTSHIIYELQRKLHNNTIMPVLAKSKQTQQEWVAVITLQVSHSQSVSTTQKIT
jgi:hypothetical protein